MSSSREQFEEWQLATYCGGVARLQRCSNDPNTYYFSDVQLKWKTWQASRAALLIELPETEYYGDSWSGAYALPTEETRDAIEAAGVTVKP